MDALLAVVAVVLAMAFPFVAAAVLLGWLVPLIMGIVHRRRGRGGPGLIALGVVWGVLAAGIVAWVGYTYTTYSRRSTPESFDPEEYAGETGRIVIPWQGPCELAVWAENGDRPLLLSSDTGEIVAPVGRYRPQSWELRATDDSGREWCAEGRPGYEWQEQRSALIVKADTPARLDVGPPLTASVSAQEIEDDKISLDLTIVGRGGGEYTISCDGRDDPPGFEMVDASGKVVLTGDFEYG